MTFIPPQQDELQQFFSNLTYENKKTWGKMFVDYSGQRILLKELAKLINNNIKEKSPRNHKILIGLGALIYKLTGSGELFEKVKTGMRISKENPLDDKTVVIGIAELYDYLKEQNNPAINETLTQIEKFNTTYCGYNLWPFKVNCFTSLEKTVTKSINNLFEPLEKLLKEFPVSSKLYNSIIKIEEEYLKQKPNGTHKYLAKAVTVIAKTCQYSFSDNRPTATFFYTPPDFVLRGLGMYSLGKIEKELGVGASLYAKLWQDALNGAILSPRQLPNKELRAYYNALFQHIEYCLDNQEMLRCFINSKDNVKDIINELHTIQLVLAKQLIILLKDVSEDKDHTLSTWVGNKIDYFTRYVFNVSLARSVSQHMPDAVTKVAQPLVLSAVTGLCVMFFGPSYAGVMLSVKIGREAANHIPVLISSSCVTMAQTLGEKIGKTAKLPFTISIQLVENSIKYIYTDETGSKEIHSTPLIEDREFLDALKKLPDHIFSDAKKKIVAGLYGEQADKSVNKIEPVPVKQNEPEPPAYSSVMKR